jgi:hypothetical protein
MGPKDRRGSWRRGHHIYRKWNSENCRRHGTHGNPVANGNYDCKGLNSGPRRHFKSMKRSTKSKRPFRSPRQSIEVTRQWPGPCHVGWACGGDSLTSMNVGSGVTTERKTRISRTDDESARCRGSRAPDRPSDFCPSTPPPTTPSTSSGTSSQQRRTGHSEPRPCRHGARLPPRLEASGAACFAASVIRQCDKA